MLVFLDCIRYGIRFVIDSYGLRYLSLVVCWMGKVSRLTGTLPAMSSAGEPFRELSWILSLNSVGSVMSASPAAFSFASDVSMNSSGAPERINPPGGKSEAMTGVRIGCRTERNGEHRCRRYCKWNVACKRSEIAQEVQCRFGLPEKWWVYSKQAVGNVAGSSQAKAKWGGLDDSK